MPRPARIRIALGAGLLAVLGVLVAAFRPPSDPPAPVPDQAALDAGLLKAIRDGDHPRANELLRQGSNADARDDAGDTALMRAAVYADVEMMRALADRGANVRAPGRDGTPPLARAVHDRDKLRFLLERGAAVNDLVMVAAASVPGCHDSLELLSAHGGSGRAGGPAYTPLMAAAGHGDLDAVTCLLAHGADATAKSPTGFTALIAAALSGNPAVVARLLERGADPNAVCTLERGVLQTPAGVAASLGHAECLRLLLAAGADVNVQGGPFHHGALLGAATTPSTETVRLLLPTADVRATDWTGETALDWACRSGETGVAKLLRAATATAVPPPPPATPRATPSAPDAAAVRRAVAAAVPLLQRSEQTITRTRNCVSCHQHPLVSMAVSAARKRGYAVDDGIAAEQRAFILKDMSGRVRPLLLGTGIDPTLSVHVLAGMAAEGEPASRVTDALVHYLVLRQRTDGRWQQETYRPPDEASDFQFTALAVRGLRAYAPKGRDREIAARIDRARRWLQAARPADTTDRVFQLLGLGWAEAEPDPRAKAVAGLLGEQRDDGGWAQLPTLASDAYATGLALCALHEGGGVAVDHPAFRRGVGFLVRTQQADGSWFVGTRSFPVVEYATSGFPHGRSQFISAAATCWATMALAGATPEPPR